MLQVVQSLLSLKHVTLEEKRERMYAEGTSGHGAGVNMESCVLWTTAQARPRTAGTWQEAGCTKQI